MDNVKIGLRIFNYIDPQYIFEAEADLRLIINGTLKIYVNVCILYIFTYN